MDNFDIVKTLYKEKKYVEVVQFIEQNNQNNELINKVGLYYDWSMYHIFFTGNKDDENLVSKEVEDFIERIVSKYDKDELIYKKPLMKYVDMLTIKPSPNYSKINDLLDLIDFELLDEEPFISKDNNGKVREIASDKEKWFSKKTKCLEELEDYHNLIAFCELALANIKKMHNDNQIWFKRRIAIAKSHLGNIDESLVLIDECLNVKRDWFIIMDKGFILIDSGKSSDGMKCLIQAIEAPGEDKMKIKIFQYFSDNLSENEFSELIKLSKIYVLKLREQNGWTISYEQHGYISSLGEEYSTQKIHSLKSKILQLLHEKFTDDNPTLFGKIERILENGKSGFIQINEGGSVYFSIRNIKNIKQGMLHSKKVSFQVVESFDKSKNSKSKEAINIKVLE